MTSVIAISIGPVQDFIAAARRTSDLIAGSELLVDIARAVAESVRRQGGDLIFPSDPATDGPNKIVAILPAGSNPSAIADTARKDAQRVLDTAWDALMAGAGSLVQRPSTARNQIGGMLEFYAAWADAPTYAEARKLADRRLAGRKALRDFAQPTSQAGVPKSSLDPSRDCVTIDVPADGVAKGGIRLREGELLDAVSLLKRSLGGSATKRAQRAVPSTSDMAARGVWPALLKADGSRAAALEAEAVARRSDGLGLGDFLFAGRLQEAVRDGEIGDDDAARIAKEVRSLLRTAQIREIPPYFAIIVADGDRMGEHIAGITEPSAHQRFSGALSTFAASASSIVETHGGYLVYSGGDDVLALAPAPTALGCADELASTFLARTGRTMSAGIAIVHHLVPLQQSIERARDAEREAKKTRNAWAIALHTRGGEPRTCSGDWKTVDDVHDWVEVMRSGALSRGFPYELRNLARELGGVAGAAGIVGAEATRILKRKRETGAEREASPGAVARAETMLSGISDPGKLEEIATMLIVARFLSEYPRGGK